MRNNTVDMRDTDRGATADIRRDGLGGPSHGATAPPVTDLATPGWIIRGARALGRVVGGDRGAETAEYAIATMAAVGFAGLLVIILKGDEVREILTNLVRDALTP